jgi:hypothetical protein
MTEKGNVLVLKCVIFCNIPFGLVYIYDKLQIRSNGSKEEKRSNKTHLLFGCHISVINFIRGGRKGYSFGKCRCALKNPPSL